MYSRQQLTLYVPVHALENVSDFEGCRLSFTIITVLHFKKTIRITLWTQDQSCLTCRWSRYNVKVHGVSKVCHASVLVPTVCRVSVNMFVFIMTSFMINFHFTLYCTSYTIYKQDNIYIIKTAVNTSLKTNQIHLMNH